MIELNKILIAGALAAVIAAPVSAQVCKTDTIRPSVNPERLINNDDGTVTDAQTGLVWMQCSIGQTWAADGCSGAPTDFTWSQALQAANQFNHNGGLAEKTDWRIPNIKELGSLVEHQCTQPAINVVHFPDTPSATYFSSTVKVDTAGNVMGGRYIDFSTGSDLSPEISALRYIRLVRSN